MGSAGSGCRGSGGRKTPSYAIHLNGYNGTAVTFLAAELVLADPSFSQSVTQGPVTLRHSCVFGKSLPIACRQPLRFQRSRSDNRVVLGSAIENGIRRPPSWPEFWKGTGRRDGIRHLKMELTVCGVPSGHPVAHDEYVDQCAAGRVPEDVPPTVAAILTRHAPAAAKMNPFYGRLFHGDLHAQYLTPGNPGLRHHPRRPRS